MHQMFPWGARGSQESPQQISAQYNKIRGRKHHFAFGPYRPTLNVFQLKISPKFYILAKISNFTKMHQMFPWGARGSQESPSRFQLNTTRLEEENTILLLDPTVQLWTFSNKKYLQNFTFWPKNKTSRKCTKCFHEGQGGHRRVHSRFQLNTTRLEGENTFSFKTLTVPTLNVFLSKISPKFYILAKISNVTKMNQMFPWGARGSQESPQQISAQYNKIGGRKHNM